MESVLVWVIGFEIIVLLAILFVLVWFAARSSDSPRPLASTPAAAAPWVTLAEDGGVVMSLRMPPIGYSFHKPQYQLAGPGDSVRFRRGRSRSRSRSRADTAHAVTVVPSGQTPAEATAAAVPAAPAISSPLPPRPFPSYQQSDTRRISESGSESD